MKKLLVSLIILSSLFLNGCFNYRDMNKLSFVTASCIDIDEEDNIILYLEVFETVESSGEPSKALHRGEGKTLFEALRNINLESRYKMSFTQNKVVLFTESAATKGLDYFIDFYYRDQETLIRPRVCMLKGDPDKIFSVFDIGFFGLYFDRLLDNIKASSRSIEVPINDYLIQRTLGDKANVISIVEMNSDIGKSLRPFINGGAVIHKDKLVGTISSEDSQGFNFLLNNLVQGTLEVTNPDFPDSFVTLEILRSKTDTKMSQEGDKVKVVKSIKINTAIDDVQKGLRINDENLKQIKETVEHNIMNASYRIFDEYKDKDLDIFDFSEEYLRTFRKEPKEDIIKDMDLVVNVEVTIESGNDTLDFPSSHGK